jgi:hypothetical protein
MRPLIWTFRICRGFAPTHVAIPNLQGHLAQGSASNSVTQPPSDVLSCPSCPVAGGWQILAKARRRGGYVLLTMSTPAPALVITTPAVAGGALLMISEAMHDRATQVRGGRLPSEKPLLALERAVD